MWAKITCELISISTVSFVCLTAYTAIFVDVIDGEGGLMYKVTNQGARSIVCCHMLLLDWVLIVGTWIWQEHLALEQYTHT